jgi:hypothetical protein
VAVVTALAVVAGLGAFLRSRNWGEIPLPRLRHGCTVQADGEVFLGVTQMANAATIAAMGIQQKMPERAIVVALSTALQESKLENLAGGDRDSVGLFQQRPSQGWGTPAQISDPRYAAKRFYAALKKVRGWEDMRVTDAAQRVQRSAYPEAYEKWADEATVLTKALNGNAAGAVACSVPDAPALRGDAAAAALTEEIKLDWGLRPAAPDELVGLAVAAADAKTGWRYAHWLVSHASDHGVMRVTYGDLEWTARAGEWEQVTEQASGDQVIAEVFDEG